LSDHVPDAIPVTVSRRDIAASLGRYSRGLATAYTNSKAAYLTLRRDLPLARRVARLIKDESIDIVHNNNTLSGNRVTVMAARMAGVPQVCHVRMLHKFSAVDRYLSRFVHTFIYISKAVEQLYQSLGIPARKGQVIYNPIDLEAFRQVNGAAELRAEFGLSEADRLIGNVGRLDWWKGHDDFLRAMAEVVRVQPNAKALIVGAPDTSDMGQVYFQRLQQLVFELELSGHVIFTGFRSDIARIMAASDVVVHSASEPEPFGRVVAEAMAAGRPVVATAAGGVIELVNDQVNGLMIPPKNPGAMAQAIQQLLHDRERAHLMGQRAQAYLTEHFTSERSHIAVERIYQSLLGASR